MCGGAETILVLFWESSMRFLLRWSVKLSLAGLLYVAVTSGATAMLSETFFGTKVAASAQQ